MRLLVPAALACIAAVAAAQQRPNEVIYKSDDWHVVRSVREQGNVVACTGFYKHNPRVQLSRDTFIVKLPKQVEVKTVAVGFERAQMRAPRPLSDVEAKLGAVVFEGADFEQLVKSRVVWLVMGNEDGKRPVRFDLRTMEPALSAVRECKPA